MPFPDSGDGEGLRERERMRDKDKEIYLVSRGKSVKVLQLEWPLPPGEEQLST